jgi:PAS domain S-box-containing protein
MSNFGEGHALIRGRRRRLVFGAIATGVGYYLGAKIGFALTASAEPISTLWPPNAILMGALLLAPVNAWLPILLGTLPAHLLVELQKGIPIPMALSWFVSNCAEALIGASCIRYAIPRPVRFDSVRRVAIFVGFGAFFASFLSSFLDVAFVQWNAWETTGTTFGSLWRNRFFSDVLAILMIVPIVKRFDAETFRAIGAMPRRRLVEAGLLGVSLLAVCTAAMSSEPNAVLSPPVLLCIPLPFLLWGAVRFGTGGASASLLAISILSIWGAVHGEGPFVGPAEPSEILSLQLFLIVTYIPIMVLAALLRERMHAESLARRDEERLNLVLSAAQMGTWDLDISTGRTTLGGRSREIFGLVHAPHEIGWSSFTATLSDPERARVELATSRAIERDEPFEVEVQIDPPGAHTRWVLSKGRVVRDAAGRPVRMLGIHVDVTERKQAEAALREEATLRALSEELEQRVAERTAELSLINRVLLEEIDVRERIGRALRASEERFAKAFRASPDAISIIRRSDARLIEVNERWVAMFGYPREEAVGQTLTALGIAPRDPHRDGLGMLSTPQGSVRDAEVELRNRRGEALYALVTSETVEVAGEQCLITMIRDVTERRRAEHEVVEQRRQLAHLGRVALLGELSGALAHELNQPLAAILANARAGQRMLFRDELDRVELSRILEDIAADDRRAGSVIHRVRAMLRQGETEPQRVVANDLIEEVLDLAHSDLIQRSVMVTTRLDPSLPAVAADRVQLQQVLLNLIVNACDAMGENPQTDRHIWIATANEGAAIRVSVSDCGSGINRHPVDSVFDPFVTSKPHGLGLGLSICRSIVDGHGGRMWAANNEDRGATFTFLLPRTEVALEVPPAWRTQDMPGLRLTAEGYG